MLGCRGCRLHRGARHRSPDISRCAGSDVVRFCDRDRRSTGRGWESLDFPAGCGRCSRRHILDPRPLVEGWNTTRPVADRSARRARATGHARHPGAAEQLGLDGLPHGPRRALDAESQCRSLPRRRSIGSRTSVRGRSSRSCISRCSRAGIDGRTWCSGWRCQGVRLPRR